MPNDNTTCTSPQRLLVLGLLFAACAAEPKKETNLMTTHSTASDLARRYFSMWNSADIAAADSILASNVTGHANGATLHGPETFKQRVTHLWKAYPDAKFSLDDLVATEDRVVVRWTFSGKNIGPFPRRPATGHAVAVTGMNLFRIEAGKIAEVWVSADDLGELEQLGLIKPPAL